MWSFDRTNIWNCSISADRREFIVSLTIALAAGAGAGEQTAFAQATQDPRVVDLVRAGELRVGLGLGVLMQAVKNPTTGELRGAALEMARALAARIGVRLVTVEYPRPGAVMARSENCARREA
jgi:polar amino acid transport system substrate-binding protein